MAAGTGGSVSAVEGSPSGGGVGNWDIVGNIVSVGSAELKVYTVKEIDNCTYG